jgi:DNA-binding MarR family transcriptional regulator
MAMVRIIDFLEGDGLIERRADHDDRRVRRLFLTSKGRPVIKTVLHLAELARLETFVGVSERDRVVFMKVLEKLHANLDTLLSDAASASGTSMAPVIPLQRRKVR